MCKSRSRRAACGCAVSSSARTNCTLLSSWKTTKVCGVCEMGGFPGCDFQRTQHAYPRGDDGTSALGQYPHPISSNNCTLCTLCPLGPISLAFCSVRSCAECADCPLGETLPTILAGFESPTRGLMAVPTARGWGQKRPATRVPLATPVVMFADADAASAHYRAVIGLHTYRAVSPTIGPTTFGSARGVS